MEIFRNHNRKYFYHFTHIDNLASILKNGLLSTNRKNQLGLPHVNVASTSIQNRRRDMDVPCGFGGKVHDYVPFYFTTTNPMLLSVLNSKNIDQQAIIFLGLSIENLCQPDTIYTDASANTDIAPIFYDDPNDLENLDWDAIDSRKWSCNSADERHRRMAEVLIHDKIEPQRIDVIIVWNEYIRRLVKKTYAKSGLKLPELSYSPFRDRHFFFTKFLLGKKYESLITGPVALKQNVESAISYITSNQNNCTGGKRFRNLLDALGEIENDFCCIFELEGIYKLKTSNPVHSENVSDHTLSVVKELINGPFYKNFSFQDQRILELSAYLHDIGKGPHSKWKNGIQQAYPDHPADAIPMLEKNLVENFVKLSKYTIRKICILVAYHDLVGDILQNGRKIEEIIDIVEDKNELDMLIAINFADVSAIKSRWADSIYPQLSSFRRKVIKKINKR